jgi:outer membrane protein insertion porin family
MMTRAAQTILACMVLLLAMTTGLAAQSSDQEWYVNKPIKDFRFTGLITVKADDVKAVVKPYIGQTFSVDPLLWEIEAKLYALDYFETIVPNAVPEDDTKSAVIIEFQVKERPSVVAVEVVGNTNVRANEITDKVLLKKGDLANQTRLQADIEAIKSLYLEKGYTDVTVTGSFVPADKDNTVKAVFRVAEGAPTTIKEVRFSGNKFASDSTLRGLMKTKPQFLFDSGVFQESKLEDDKTAIVSYYTDHGFVDAKVDNVTRDVQSQQGRNYLLLTVYLTEGDQWTYGGMKFNGNQIFSAARLSELVYQKQGKTLSLPKVEQDVSRIQNLYWENGYIFNIFNRTENRDAAAKTITYTLNIQEADKAHIEAIIFKGNTRTQESVLRRGMPFEEGDIFNREKIIQGYQYLQNLQFFKTVTPDTQQGSAFGLMNVIFNLEETSTADINFGVIFSGGNFPVSGTIKWNERNFLGRGQTVGVDLEASPIKQLVSLNFVEPWLFKVPWSVGLSLSLDHESVQNVLQDFVGTNFSDAQAGIAAPDPFDSRADYLAAVASGQTVPLQYLMTYDMWNFTLGANTGYVFSFPFLRLGFQGGYNPQLRRIDFDETQFRPFDVSVRQNNHTWNFIDQITLGAYLDGRDIYWNPTKGFYVGQSATFTGGILFGSRHFIRTDSRLEGFLTLLDTPLFENWNLQFVLAAHTGLSLILPNFTFPSLTWQTVTDSTEQLYIDGMTVGRGWSNLYTYGNALWDNKLELRMPIVKEAIWLVGFFDMAALWDAPEDINFNPDPTTELSPLRFSLGFGVRFTIPQFPIRLYFSKEFQIMNTAPGTQTPQWQVVWKDPEQIPAIGLSFVISLGGDVF